MLNDSSIIRKNAHVEFNCKNLRKIRFVKVNSLPAVGERLKIELYVDDAISSSKDEPTLARKEKKKDFNNPSLSNKLQITLNSEPTDDNYVLTKAYLNSLSENDGNREYMSTVFIDQDTEFDKNKVIFLDSIYFDREPTLPKEVSVKKDIDNESDKNALLRFKQTLQNYHKVSVGNDIHDITKISEQEFIDTKVMKDPSQGGYLLRQRKMRYSWMTQITKFT